MRQQLFGQFDSMVESLLAPPVPVNEGPYRCVDLFCGIGGFHLAAKNLGLKGRVRQRHR